MKYKGISNLGFVFFLAEQYCKGELQKAWVFYHNTQNCGGDVKIWRSIIHRRVGFLRDIEATRKEYGYDER